MSDEPREEPSLPPTLVDALRLENLPWPRIASVLGMDPSAAPVTLRDEDSARTAVVHAQDAYLAADDDRRAGRTPSSPIAAHPDFPTTLGMSLIGAGVLWDAMALIPQLALRVAKDHYAGGQDALAANYAAMVGEVAEAGRDDTEAWAAQSLLVAILSRHGSPEDADALARDLAAHGVPIDLWKDDAPHLPDDSMTWHGGALVEGLPPRRDGRSLSVEDAGEYLQEMLRATLREHEAEDEGEESAGGGPPA